MTFTVTIQIGEGAVTTADDVARALREVADELDAASLEDEEGGLICDANGQPCGSWGVEDT